jgi:hypothetical protein
MIDYAVPDEGEFIQMLLNAALGRLLILTGTVATAALASPIYYTIGFTTDSGGPNPLSGSFYYDPNNTVDPFSAFVVVWDGVTLDFTAAANSGASQSNRTGCVTNQTPAAIFAILDGTACTAPELLFWDVWIGFSPYYTVADPNDIVFAFYPVSALTSGSDYFGPEFTTVTPISPIMPTGGEYSITSTPELSTTIFILAGSSILVLLGRKRETALFRFRSTHF